MKLRSPRVLYWRIARAVWIASLVITASLSLGVLGYRHFAGFGWVDSLLNASMILSGMGPVGSLNSNSAKVFASAYALFSGLVLVTANGIILSPVFHLVLHRFHSAEEDIR